MKNGAQQVGVVALTVAAMVTSGGLPVWAQVHQPGGHRATHKPAPPPPVPPPAPVRQPGRHKTHNPPPPPPPIPPRAPEHRGHLTVDQRHEIKQALKAERLQHRTADKNAIQVTSGKLRVERTEIKADKHELRGINQQIRAARKAGDKTMVEQLKGERKTLRQTDLKVDRHNARLLHGDLVRDKEILHRVDGKGAQWSPPSDHHLERTAAAAPKDVRKQDRDNIKTDNKTIKTLKAQLAAEADPVKRAEIRSEIRRERRIRDDVDKQKLLHDQGYRYVKNDSGGFGIGDLFNPDQSNNPIFNPDPRKNPITNPAENPAANPANHVKGIKQAHGL